MRWLHWLLFGGRLLGFLILAAVTLAECTKPAHAEPCGDLYAVCVSALEDAGVDPFAWMPELDYRRQWITAFSWVRACESGPNPEPTIRGRVDPRDRGIWQINAFYHPEVTDEVAFDPVASTRWAAQAWANGGASWWRCFTIYAAAISPQLPVFALWIPWRL